jgi:drug/metabolite transporter (DMT)-like permease
MDTRLPLDGRAVGLMGLLCLVWSLQQISLKAVATDVSPILMVGLRSGVAALLVAALMLWRGEGLQLRSGRWRAGLVVGALFAIEYLLVAESLRLTLASHVVVFLYTAPIFAALGLHWKFVSERLQWAQWVGIGIAFAGIAVAFLGRSPGGTDPADGRFLLGDLLALLAGAAWGATTLTIRCSRLAAAPATLTLLYQLIGAFVLLVPAALALGQSRFEPSLAAWGHLAFQSVIVSFASFLVWFWLLRKYLASRLGVFSFTTPVFGVVLGIWLLDEPLEASFLAGSALVLTGILLVSGYGWVRQALGGGRTKGMLSGRRARSSIGRALLEQRESHRKDLLCR